MISLDSSKTKLHQFVCELRDHYIFINKVQSGKLYALMNINYALVKVHYDVEVNDQVYHVLKFCKNKNYEELFTTDK